MYGRSLSAGIGGLVVGCQVLQRFGRCIGTGGGAALADDLGNSGRRGVDDEADGA